MSGTGPDAPEEGNAELARVPDEVQRKSVGRKSSDV
jgi:hypothetical protein